ncbi:MAG: gliding motility-associated C-terminal domain-containing protein [Bacteroidales bacterium]|nr:gliding motility-associated C-terminal domain-containing protein [Bacteroidales bacterium]
MKSKFLLLAVLFVLSFSVFSQTYLINNYNGSTLTACSGTLYDSGGSSGNYGNSQYYTMTVAPGTAGLAVQLTISYDLESGYDYLYIYNGTSTSAPLLATLNGSGNITLVATNSTNSLFLEFDTDGTVTKTGFSAVIACTSPPAPTQFDCLGAKPVCGSSYTETSPTYGVNNGQGYYLNEIFDDGNDCHTADNQPGIWYVFTVQTTGTLRFTIDPVNDADDYDWVLFNLTNYTCADLAVESTHDAAEVSSNTAGESYDGPTGINSDNSDYDSDCTGPGDSYGNQWNGDITVTQGEQYVLYVANYEQTIDGYTVTFNQGSSNIIDVDAPLLEAITSSPACGESEITFDFTERVLCSSVNSADFNVTGPGGTYSVTSIDCNSGAAYSESFTITLNTALTSGGTYSLNLIGQVDDACNNSVSGNSLSFSVTGVTASASVTQIVSCFGGNNGAATVTASGGTAPYSYYWSNAASTQSISGLSAASYQVTVTDNIGVCQNVQSITITQPTQITSTFTTNHVDCYGNATGSSTVNPANGTPGYTYLWDSNAGSVNTATASGLTVGSYQVSVYDSHSCLHTNNVNITEPSPLAIDSVQLIQPSCYGGSNGQIIVHNTHGGTAPYNITWSNSATGASISGLSAGDYYGTITDAHGCFITNSPTPFVLAQPSDISISELITDALCYGGSNGSVALTPSGGTPGYTYTWGAATGGQTTSSAIGLSAGTYLVTVYDNHMCSKNTSYTVGEASQISASVSSISNAHCGLPDGSATITASGGTGTLTYTWNTTPTQTGSTISGVSAGTYTASIEDENGCVRTFPVNISDDGAPSISLVSQFNVSCFGGNDGAATVSASGGTGTLAYSWSSSTNTTNSEANLSQGSYTAYVTDSAGCVSSIDVNITQPSNLIAVISNESDALCNGGNSGSATVDVSGGTAPYNYTWGTTPSQTLATANNLSNGSYTVTVTDNHSCTTIAVANISEPNAVSIDSINFTSPMCYGENNGSARVVDITGGTSSGTYNVNWLTSPTQNGYQAVNLGFGTYTVVASDDNGCSDTASVTVIQPTLLQANVLGIDVLCNQSNDGYAIASAIGGTISSDFTYTWDANAANQSNDTAFNLSAGHYLVAISDDNGCVDTASIDISEPTILNSIISFQNVSCYNGSDAFATVSTTGGTSPYSYLWSFNSETNDTLSNLSFGNYYVTTYDNNACFAVDTILINQPTELTVSANSVNATCFGQDNGQVNLIVSGGTNPYTYTWSNGSTNQNIVDGAGTYSVIVIDNNNCSDTLSSIINQPTALSSSFTISQPNCGNNDGVASINPTGGIAPYQYYWETLVGNDTLSQTADSLYAGNYSVTIYDDNGCAFDTTASLTDLSAATISLDSIVHNRCFADSLGYAQVTVVSGGTAPFMYTWKKSGVIIQNGNEANIDSLSAGSYSVIVTDDNGCASSQSFNIEENDQLLASIQIIDAIQCFNDLNGSLLVNATGGTTPYSYNWSYGSVTTADLNNIGAGQYTVTVTDDSLCTYVKNITINQPSALSISLIDSVMATCNGDSNGSLHVQAIGGTPVYSFLWSNSSSGNTINYLSAGSYTVSLYDDHNCLLEETYTITEPTAISSDITITNSICGGHSGSILISPNGGTGSYTYSWQHDIMLNNALAESLTSGIYYVTIYDSLMCSHDTLAQISDNGSGTLAINNINDALCYGSYSGSVNIDIVGGTPGYNYSIELLGAGTTNGSSATSPFTIGSLSYGSYSITVVDGNNCQSDSTFTIGQPESISASYVSQNIKCYGNANGSIDITVNGGTPGYNYYWSNSETTQDINNLPPGTYHVTISDQNACPKLLSNIHITEPTELIANLDNYNHLSCYNNNTGSIEASAEGGIAPYQYMWSNGSQDSSLDSLSAGIYILTVTDQNNCTDTIISNISQPNMLFVNDSVYMENNYQTIELNPSGGTPSYAYVWSNGEISDKVDHLYSGYYEVTVTDINGCTAYKTYKVEIELIIPSVITPNGDGKNDRFDIVNIESIDNLDIKIINRWGDEVFAFSGSGLEYKDPNNQWDGTFNGIEQNISTFVYIIDLHDGNSYKSGTLTIVR